MSKLNGTDRWAVESDLQHKHIWMIASRAKKKTFTWLSRSRSLEFGFSLHSPSFWDKWVNLLRDECGLPYVYIILLICMSVRRGLQEGLWLPGF